MTDAPDLLRTRRYWVLLVLSAGIGVVVPLASWAFLEVTHWLQVGVYQRLPASLGFASAPPPDPLGPKKATILAASRLLAATTAALTARRGAARPATPQPLRQ